MNLSLSSWMKQIDSTDWYLECALSCYKTALASIRANLVVSDPTVYQEEQVQLRRTLTALEDLVRTVCARASERSEHLNDVLRASKELYSRATCLWRIASSRTKSESSGLVC